MRYLKIKKGHGVKSFYLEKSDRKWLEIRRCGKIILNES